MILLGFVITLGAGIIIGSFLPENFGAITPPAYVPFSITAFLIMCANIAVLLILPIITVMTLLCYFLNKIEDWEKRVNCSDWIFLLAVVLYVLYATFLEKTELIYRLF